ncbi:hypothetical protein AU467_25600 [Mesorhizobium loti]|uniref:Uncharacterized protein n=1 Tax=Rhizobium loti TaxID=381 RepID=A0A101KRN9_RHILI|nr:hypothetical protein AU467_25600 [Mesorhizobium loti]
MSALQVYDHAPLGSLIAYSDGAPKPPARFSRKLRDWESRNGVGRLVKKEPPRERPTYSSPACFTLHEGDFGSDGIVIVTVMRTYTVDSALTFKVRERPTVGMVRVIQAVGDNSELIHLAEEMEAAELWLARHPHFNVRLEEVTADVVEGRAAA